jgi:hypothetical protein
LEIIMPTFDPVALRKAVAEFTPARRSKFHDLTIAREFILELRKKGASYPAIAELLTQHGLPTTRSTIAAFCHTQLRERVRRRRKKVTAPDSRRTPAPTPSSLQDHLQGDAQPTAHPPGSHGPRIAKLRYAKQP